MRTATTQMASSAQRRSERVSGETTLTGFEVAESTPHPTEVRRAGAEAHPTTNASAATSIMRTHPMIAAPSLAGRCCVSGGGSGIGVSSRRRLTP